jgi:hypothetical protein
MKLDKVAAVLLPPAMMIRVPCCTVEAVSSVPMMFKLGIAAPELALTIRSPGGSSVVDCDPISTAFVPSGVATFDRVPALLIVHLVESELYEPAVVVLNWIRPGLVVEGVNVPSVRNSIPATSIAPSPADCHALPWILPTESAAPVLVSTASVPRPLDKSMIAESSAVADMHRASKTGAPAF